MQILKQKVGEALKKAFDIQDELVEIHPCLQESFGHYQCNLAMKLAKKLKTNPRDVASTLIDHIEKEAVIEKLEIAGPGFINITLDPKFLSSQLNEMVRDPYLGVPRPEKKQKIIVEFSSPNIAKELHVGHLRSTIIGESLARLFEFLGHDVLRLNHIGDWGTQFGMLITYMKEHVADVFSNPSIADLSQLMTWYKASKKAFDADPAFKKRSQNEVVALQNRDADTLKAWDVICEISRKAFVQIYDLLDVSIQERGESFYNPYLKNMVDELEKKGHIEISDGAKCIFLEGFKNREGKPLPLMVQKSDGGFNYDTTDLAALYYRVTEDKAERIIIVTDLGQSLHFQLVFKAGEKVGFYDPKKVELNHVTFGVVLAPDGKKFKTRSGETEKLIDLLTKAIKRAKTLVLQKTPDISEKEADYLAHHLGVAAVKYADLSTQRTKDYTFSYERMLKFEGNTAVFLLYSFVRVMGIKRKANKKISDVLKHHKIELNHPSEITLGLHLLRFQNILESVGRDLFPHRLCDYLYELAEKFNAFFRDCKVIDQKEEGSRLLLCELSSLVLKQGLDILGIKTVDRM